MIYTSDMAKIVLGLSSITTRAGRMHDVARFVDTDVVNVRIESELFRKCRPFPLCVPL